MIGMVGQDDKTEPPLPEGARSTNKPHLQKSPLMEHKKTNPLPGMKKPVLAVLAAVLVWPVLMGAEPAWWQQRGVFSVEPADDFALVNHGQLKHLAKQAKAELDAELSGGAGSAIAAMVGAWDTPQQNTDDYAPVNVGQLKAVAKPFYDRLKLPYPWAGAPAGAADDFAVANVGQLKRVFAFDPASLPVDDLDTDGDGLPDWFESLLGTDPEVADSDEDGTDDGAEYYGETDPLNVSDEGELPKLIITSVTR